MKRLCVTEVFLVVVRSSKLNYFSGVASKEFEHRTEPFWIRLDSIGVKNKSETIDPIYTEFVPSIVYSIG